jgi:phosphate transport system substrate-binding protein
MQKIMPSHPMSKPLFLLLVIFISSISQKMFAETLHITGCGISKKAYLEKALAIYSERQGLVPRLSGGGATKGLRLAAKKQVDLGASCRQRLADIGGNIHEQEKDINLIQVGWDALVVIVNRDNSLSNITQENLIKIFKGDVISWGQLGIEDKPITLLTRKEKISGVGYMARLLVFGDVSFEFPESVFVYDSTVPIEKNILRRKYSLAFDGLSSAQKIDVKMLSINGIYPSKDHVSSGKYPYFRPLYLAVNKHNKSEKVKGFIEFILGPEGQDIISNEGSINLYEGKLLTQKWLKITSSMGKLYQE